jgi:hypothetical protein
LDLPATPREQGVTRNLVWGIVLLSLAAIGYWMGLYYAGAAATRTLIACLLTFGVIWLLLNLNVLRQRYGGLLGLGMVAFIGTAIPFIEGGFRRLDGLARERLAGETLSPAALSVPPPPVTTATAPPAPPTIPLPGDDRRFAATEPALDPVPPAQTGKSAQAGPAKTERATPVKEAPKAPLATKPAGPDGLRELIVPEPPEGAGKLIRVKEDVKVELDGRPTIIRGGTVAPFKELNDGLVTFLAGDHEVSIAMELVTFTGASKEKPADITKLAQQEVMRRYPKLREEDSRENILFVTRVKELQLDPEMKGVFFEDPKWPLVLAEQLAQQENWARADLPPDEAAAEAPTPEKPGSPAEIPANELPADKDSLLSPTAPPLPQRSEPPPPK